MKYIEENEYLTREFEVSINEAELERIKSELEKYCCRNKNVSINVTASDEKEAIQKVNSIKKNEVSVVRKNEILNNEKKLINNKAMYMYECQYYYQQIPYLAHLLNIILNSYRYQPKIADITKAVDSLVEYENNDELKPYEWLMAKNGITEELYLEYEHNKDFDFKLLNDLYQQAKKCFTLVLISETIHYDDEDKEFRTYKLRRR